VKRIICLVVFIFLMFTMTGCSSVFPGKKEEKPALIKTSVMLDWTVNTNHTGLYVAKEKGYYAEEGLEVEILQSGDPGPAQLIAAGKLDFGVSYQEQVTHARASGIPLVSLAAVIQHNTSGLASLKEANLLRPRDLEGKRYGGWGSPAEHAVIEAVMTKDGGNPQEVEFIDIGAADFFSIIGKSVDFTWIFQGWDGIQAELKNVPLNIIMLKDFDDALDYYTPTIATSESMIKEKPDLARKFMLATSRGYEYAIAHPEEAAKILLKYAPELNAELVMESQKWLSAQYRADAPQWGWQEKEVWERYATWMYERGLLSKMIETDKAFTNDFLPKR